MRPAPVARCIHVLTWTASFAGWLQIARQTNSGAQHFHRHAQLGNQHSSLPGLWAEWHPPDPCGWTGVKLILSPKASSSPYCQPPLPTPMPVILWSGFAISLFTEVVTTCPQPALPITRAMAWLPPRPPAVTPQIYSHRMFPSFVFLQSCFSNLKRKKKPSQITEGIFDDSGRQVPIYTIIRSSCKSKKKIHQEMGKGYKQVLYRRENWHGLGILNKNILTYF